LSGLDFNVAAWSRHTHQNVASLSRGLQSSSESMLHHLGAICDTTPQRLDGNRNGIPPATFPQPRSRVCRGYTHDRAGTHNRCVLCNGDAASLRRCQTVRVDRSSPVDALRANSERPEYCLAHLHERRWPAEKHDCRASGASTRRCDGWSWVVASFGDGRLFHRAPRSCRTSVLLPSAERPCRNQPFGACDAWPARGSRECA